MFNFVLCVQRLAMNIDEKVPANKPNNTGRANSRMEETPIIVKITIAAIVVIVVKILLDKVCAIDLFTTILLLIVSPVGIAL
mgnify:CR=1 FL=1